MANSYLNRTTGGSPTNATIWTFSAWIKRGVFTPSSSQKFFGAGSGSSDRTEFYLATDGHFAIYKDVSGSSVNLASTRRFRDTNAWYHFVVQNNNGTVTVYVNNETVSLSSASLGTNKINAASTVHYVGRQVADTTQNFFGMISHFHFVDGSIVAPTVFGETDSTTGIWKINSSPSVTYGDDGFFILKDGNNLSGSTVQDQSGKGNNFTATGNLTSMKDCPDNVFNTLSPIDIPIAGTSTAGTLPTLSNANTSITNSNSAFREIRSNIYVTKGKYYFEAKPTRIGGSGAFQVGVQLRNYSSGTGERRAYQNNGYKYTPGSASYGASYAANDVVGVALNLTDGEITFYKNGVSQGVAATDMLSGMDNVGWTAAASCYDADGHFNFGNGYFGTTAVSSAQNPDDGIGIFEYDPPTGYRAICTKSLNAQEYS